MQTTSFADAEPFADAERRSRRTHRGAALAMLSTAACAGRDTVVGLVNMEQSGGADPLAGIEGLYAFVQQYALSGVGGLGEVSRNRSRR